MHYIIFILCSHTTIANTTTMIMNYKLNIYLKIVISEISFEKFYIRFGIEAYKTKFQKCLYCLLVVF